MIEPSVTSEIGKLETVLVHRPGIEIGRLTPDNKEALLFDDLLWLDRAQDEHDAFVGLMMDRGVEVLHFDRLLTDVMELPEARDSLLRTVFTPARCGPRASEALIEMLTEVSAEKLVEVLVGGILEHELGDWGLDPLFADLVADRYHHVLSPLPNLLFMSDNASWIGSVLSRNVLKPPARQRESMYMASIYDRHPLLSQLGSRPVFGAEHADVYPASLEGSDVLVLDEHTVCLGVSECTARSSIEILVLRRFAETPIDQEVVVRLRITRALMHLDTAFTMVDHATFNIFPGLLVVAGIHPIRPQGDHGLGVGTMPSIESALLEALSLEPITMNQTSGDAIGRFREQWDDGNNALALEPGVVVAYSRNVETNRQLLNHGIEVLELDSSELCRGRGEVADA